MERWEYTSFKVETKGLQGAILDIEDLNAELNELGEQGWEISILYLYKQGTRGNKRSNSYFKKKKVK